MESRRWSTVLTEVFRDKKSGIEDISRSDVKSMLVAHNNGLTRTHEAIMTIMESDMACSQSSV